MEVVSILTGKRLLSVESILELFRAYTEQAELIASRDVVLRTSGRFRKDNAGHIRELQRKWAALRSYAPHISDNHPELTSLRTRFINNTQPDLARKQEEEDFYAMFANRDYAALDAFAPVC